MSNPRLFLPGALTALALAACSPDEVRTYRVPKEKDPEMPSAQAANPAAGESTNALPSPAPADMASTAVPVAEGSGLTWDAPAGWTLGPAAPMRKATFKIPGPGGAAEMSITAFPKDVGGELANLNRWRGQLHLSSLDEPTMGQQIARRTMHALDFAVVDFTEASGAPTATRLLGAIVPYSGSTWFFKMTGPAATVAAGQADFEKFLASVRPAERVP